LMLPYNHYKPSSREESPIINFVIGDSIDHYREHIPWIAEIVAKGEEPPTSPSPAAPQE
jgi:hypothetical protein